MPHHDPTEFPNPELIGPPMTDPTITDIPADTQITMIEELLRLFRMEGCEPACHACGEPILIGQTFTLASVVWRNSNIRKDEMIGSCCTKEKLLKVVGQDRKDWIRRGRGYSRPSTISRITTI